MLAWLTQILQAMPLTAQVLLALWVVTLVTMPTLERMWGERAMTLGISAGVILQAALVVILLVSAHGWRNAALSALAIVILGWIAEFIGLRTGFPFGYYAYTERLKPQLGHVPVLIPIAWLMMLPPAWAVSYSITGETRGIAFILVSGLAFTVWDLYLDPQMVRWRLWTWSDRMKRVPGIFSIPWTNYAGWFAVSALITLVIAPDVSSPEPMLLVYGLTWILEMVGQLVFWRLPGPALAGAAGMGVCLLLALMRMKAS